ncbi:MAG: prepilin-type N-terminal cleavage/methylation domain-containing protein [Candidatus Melainabacteria bacterium]|nr:prepilin-type N-terminal cleavage/methylation domain-containing protein [Candidatus Melainabacteria bacterium]
MQRNRKTNNFTLLEMMVALVILSFIGAFTAVHVKKLIDSHRFESEVSNFFTALQDAQVLSAAYQTDITLTLTRKDNLLSYRFSTAEPFKDHQLDQQPVSMPRASLFTFNQIKQPSLQITIYSGRLEPRGILAFAQNLEEDSKTLWIDLQRGHLLKYLTHKPVLAKQTLPTRPKGAT